MIRFPNQSTGLSSTIAGLEETILQSYILASENENTEVCLEILDLIYLRIADAISHKSITTAKQYIHLPARCYLVSKENKKLNGQLIKVLSLSLRCLNFHFTYNKRNKSNQEMSKMLLTYYEGLLAYYHYLLQEYDTELLENALNEFNQIFDLEYHNNSIRWELISPLKPKTLEEKKVLKARYNNENQFYILHRRACLILISWSLVLYENDKIDLERLKLLMKYFNIPNLHVEDLIEDIVYLRDIKNPMPLTNISWDFEEHLGEKSYSPPNLYNWILYGAVYLLIKNDNLTFSIDAVVDEHDYRFLHDAVAKFLENIRNTFDRWSNVFGFELDLSDDDTKENFEAKERRILMIFQQLRVLNEKSDDKKISNQRLHSEKIERVKNGMFASWRRQNSVIGLFTYFNSLKRVYSKENLNPVGLSTVLKGMRMTFVEDGHQEIYGINDLGSIAARALDSLFLEKVFELNHEMINKPFAKSLDNQIKALQEEGFTSDLIIIPPEYLTKDELYENPDFTFNTRSDDIVFSVGEYKGILVSTFYANIIQNQVFVCSFSHAFQMTLFHNSNLMDDKLEISISELSAKETETQFRKHYQDWNISSTGNQLDPEHVRLRIQNSLKLDIYAWVNFRIKNPKAVKLFSF
jgi:hypothetical protein